MKLHYLPKVTKIKKKRKKERKGKKEDAGCQLNAWSNDL